MPYFSQQYTDKTSASLVDDSLKRFGELHPRFVRHMGELCVQSLVHKLVQEKNLLATQEDIENLAGEIAASYEDSEAVKKEFLSDKNQVNAFGNVATETKVVEYVLSQAQTTEETVPFQQ